MIKKAMIMSHNKRQKNTHYSKQLKEKVNMEN